MEVCEDIEEDWRELGLDSEPNIDTPSRKSIVIEPCLAHEFRRNTCVECGGLDDDHPIHSAILHTLDHGVAELFPMNLYSFLVLEIETRSE
jgi:hypothetical protein